MIPGDCIGFEQAVLFWAASVVIAGLLGWAIGAGMEASYRCERDAREEYQRGDWADKDHRGL